MGEIIDLLFLFARFGNADSSFSSLRVSATNEAIQENKITLPSRLESVEIGGFYFLRKQKVAKTFIWIFYLILWIASIFYENLAMTAYVFGGFAVFLDCHEFADANSRNDGLFLDSAFKTTEGFSVWFSWFLANLGREARLGVCERPKFAKSAPNAILKTNCPKNSALFIKP